MLPLPSPPPPTSASRDDSTAATCQPPTPPARLAEVQAPPRKRVVARDAAFLGWDQLGWGEEEQGQQRAERQGQQWQQQVEGRWRRQRRRLLVVAGDMEGNVAAWLLLQPGPEQLAGLAGREQQQQAEEEEEEQQESEVVQAGAAQQGVASEDVPAHAESSGAELQLLSVARGVHGPTPARWVQIRRREGAVRPGPEGPGGSIGGQAAAADLADVEILTAGADGCICCLRLLLHGQLGRQQQAVLPAAAAPAVLLCVRREQLPGITAIEGEGCFPAHPAAPGPVCPPPPAPAPAPGPASAASPTAAPSSSTTSPAVVASAPAPLDPGPHSTTPSAISSGISIASTRGRGDSGIPAGARSGGSSGSGSGSGGAGSGRGGGGRGSWGPTERLVWGFQASHLVAWSSTHDADILRVGADAHLGLHTLEWEPSYTPGGAHQGV